MVTNPVDAEKDLTAELQTDGALIVYFGHTAQAAVGTDKWTASLNPLGMKGTYISGKKLARMLAKSKASITLLAGCNSVKCSVPSLGGSHSALVTVASGNQTHFSNNNIIALAINSFVEVLVPGSMNTQPGTVQQAIDAANAQLKAYDLGRNKFVLKSGSGSVVLK